MQMRPLGAPHLHPRPPPGPPEAGRAWALGSWAWSPELDWVCREGLRGSAGVAEGSCRQQGIPPLPALTGMHPNPVHGGVFSEGSWRTEGWVPSTVRPARPPPAL